MWISILPITEHYPQIWDDFQVPDALDKQTAIDTICMECAEIELLYSDPNLLKYMIRNWTRTEKHIWDKLADTLDLEYNPIFNLDVTWEEERTPDLVKTRTPDITETRTPNITETRNPNLKNTEMPEDTTTESVAGYNESSFTDHTKLSRGGKIVNSETGSDTKTTIGSDVSQTTGSETEKESGKERIVTKRYGNQGVTMTQDMIKAERDVAGFNLYDYIVKSFKARFCLLVY